MKRKRSRNQKYDEKDVNSYDVEHFQQFTQNSSYRTKYIENIDHNPHLEQCRGSRLVLHRNQDDVCQESTRNDKLNNLNNTNTNTNQPIRILTENIPTLQYRRRHGEVKSTIHWGQRKLMLSEIEFFTKLTHPKESYQCIYAGGAPGTHISYLSMLFPNIQFILIDPSDFVVSSSERIVIRQEFMTNNIAKEYANHLNTLFISDIRSVDYRSVCIETLEEDVKRDMSNQQTWHELIHPIGSMLKFRLPWDKKDSEYLAGDIYFPVWGPQSTTECRLIINRIDHLNSVTGTWKRRIYDHHLICNQLFYFNNVIRCNIYEHFVHHLEIDYCYDCSSEVLILHNYITNYILPFHDNTIYDIPSTISDLITRISIACSTGNRVRSLYQKKAFHSFAIKRFDVDKLQIHTVTPSNDNTITIECNTITILQDIIQSYEKSNQTVNNSNDGVHWMDIEEFPWTDVDEDRVDMGIFGGTLIPDYSAVDIWLWNIIAEFIQYNPIFSNNIRYKPQDIRQPCDKSISLTDIGYDHQDRLNMMDIMIQYTEYIIDTNHINDQVPALMLLTSTGCAYFFISSKYSSISSIDYFHRVYITKICLPTLNYSHNMSIFLTTIRFHGSMFSPLISKKEIDQILPNNRFGSKSLQINDIIAWKGQNLMKGYYAKNKKDRLRQCQEFLQRDFDFTSNKEMEKDGNNHEHWDREAILRLACFDFIEVG